MRNYGVVDKGIIRWFLMDLLSHSFARKQIAGLLFLISRLFLIPAKKLRAIELLMTAQRYYPNGFYARRVRNDLMVLPPYYQSMMHDDVDRAVAASRSIVIKMPKIARDVVVKGIIIITFTDTNRYYFHHIDIKGLLKYFHIVLEPSWAGYCLPEILLWAGYDEPIFVEATEKTDRIFLNVLESNLKPLTFGASDWVNYKKFYPIESEREYDSVYVANYNPVKRLHVYFKALAEIKRRGVAYRGAIVCASWGSSRDTALKLIKYYDVEDVLDVHESLNAEQLNALLNRSTCNMLLSLKEGSNRSIFESMFSDIPVIALYNNIGMNKDYINSSTGMLIDEADLADSLLKMMFDSSKYSPRQWAMANIAPEVTTEKLFKQIASIAPFSDFSVGEILVKTNDPEVAYFDRSIGIDGQYYMEKILSLFVKGGASDNRGEEMCKLVDEFQVARNAHVKPVTEG